MTTVPTTPARPALRADELTARLVAPAGPLGRLDVVATTGSTNDDLVAALRADPDAWPGVSMLVADHQTGGHGRAGRTWTTPAGTAVTGTFAIRAHLAPVNFGWYPLLTGLAAVRALRAVTGVPALLKWPNDVLLPAADAVDGWGAVRKVGGILAQVTSLGTGLGLGLGAADSGEAELPPGSAIVLGIGINVLQEPAELPVESASSLYASTGRRFAREEVLVALVEAFVAVLRQWRDDGNDPRRSGLPAEVAAVCTTLGRRVRVELPGGAHVDGVADRLTLDGSLVVVDEAGTSHVVLAGDVRHVRTPA